MRTYSLREIEYIPSSQYCSFQVCDSQCLISYSLLLSCCTKSVSFLVFPDPDFFFQALLMLIWRPLMILSPYQQQKNVTMLRNFSFCSRVRIECHFSFPLLPRLRWITTKLFPRILVLPVWLHLGQSIC